MVTVIISEVITVIPLNLTVMAHKCSAVKVQTISDDDRREIKVLEIMNLIDGFVFIRLKN